MVDKFFYIIEGTKGARGSEVEESEGNHSVRTRMERQETPMGICRLYATDTSCQAPVFSLL